MFSEMVYTLKMLSTKARRR